LKDSYYGSKKIVLNSKAFVKNQKVHIFH
jgi:hypothetical protein